MNSNDEIPVDDSFLNDLFNDNFDNVSYVNQHMKVNPNKMEKSIGEFKQEITSLAKKSDEKNILLSKFIERLTMKLYSDIENLKEDIVGLGDSTFVKKHEQMVSLVNKLQNEFDYLLKTQTAKENENKDENIELESTVKSLQQLNNVRDNLASSINTLTIFNNFINRDDNKKIITSVSMQNELDQRLFEKEQLTEEQLTQIKKYKDILKDFDKFYVIYTNFLIHLEEGTTSDQMAELSIQQHF